MKKRYYLFQMQGITSNVICVLLIIILETITILIKPSYVIDNSYIFFGFLLIIPYFVLHEILHSIAYVTGGADFKNVIYGAYLEKGVFYCLCKQNISRKNVLISLLTPFILIGIITYIIGIIFSNNILIFLSIMNMAGCSGDLIMFGALLSLRDFEYSEYDNPMAFGLYSKNDLSNKKFLGLKYVGEVEDLEKNNLKKITISKMSIVFLLMFLVLILLGNILY